MLVCSFFPIHILGQPNDPVAREAAKAWKQGNIPTLGKLAPKIKDKNARHYGLFLYTYVRGQYQETLKHYTLIDPQFAGHKTLGPPVLQAHLHLGKYEEARVFAVKRKMSKTQQVVLKMRAEEPLAVELNKTTEIAFAKHPLTPYFPAFAATLNGKKVLAHVDTGGAFLHMGKERAEKLGIKLIEAGKGKHATKTVNAYFGIAKSFQLGDAELTNVPVVVLPTLKGSQDFVIFGTNVLEQFLSTLDYPRKRLVLSPRKNTELRKEHERRFAQGVEVPFYLWDDHYMFARGGLSNAKSLNFFVDSGLVSLHFDTKSGKVRQAAFWGTTSLYESCGVPKELLEKKVFELPLPLSLGTLKQEGLFVLNKKKAILSTLGGVDIHGLISHTFLSRYTWTIDFDQRKYFFTDPTLKNSDRQ
ncbi:MAG: retropepsin-like aspartic protease [Gemmataceae bacterium]